MEVNKGPTEAADRNLERKYQIRETVWSTDYSTANSLVGLARLFKIPENEILDAGSALKEGYHKGVNGSMRIKYGPSNLEVRVQLYLPTEGNRDAVDNYLSQEPDSTLQISGGWSEIDEGSPNDTSSVP